MIDWSFLCQWENVQNQQGIKYFLTKSKELVVDLWRTKAPLTHVSIRGVSVNLLEDYTYLGVNMNNKLDWTKNS